MKRSFFYLFVAVLSLVFCACNKYESVANDPTQTRIYTLDNGLKIYMSVNQDEPRIQAHIAVRAGSKNDPHETTGLAHYLEHIMFKGSTNFGTTDYEAEKPLLDEIENLYENYRTSTDKDERKAIYHIIDSVSGVASNYFIANEYDKLMAAIGSAGSNAYTDYDVTCYMENIPSNEVERWAKIQSDRFKNLVIRGFHTELETVYEEFNMYLTDDTDKSIEKMNATLFKKHPYGTQTTLGTQEHLKNPSIKNIKEFFNQWYVPNNVAICLSGDFDPESTLEIIKKYFGDWTPSKNTPTFAFEPEEPMTEPEYVEVVGQEEEAVWLGWRFPGANDIKTTDMLDVIAKILNNGKTGLVDVNLLLQQKILNAEISNETQSDYSVLLASGNPNEGQSLEEVKDLLLENINKIAKGEFDENLLVSIINNKKRDEMSHMQSNNARVYSQVNSFVQNIEWKDVVNRLNRISKITKQQIVDFAKQYINDGYVVLYKRQGIDTSVEPIEKPAISPINMNREKTSRFFEETIAMKTEDIKPKFVNFDKELSKVDINGNQLVYVQNKSNGLFSIEYDYHYGNKDDKALNLMPNFFSFFRTKEMSAEEIQAELYKMACEAYLYDAERYTIFRVYGLAEYQDKVCALLEKVMTEGYIEPETFDAIRGQILRDRVNIKTNQRMCYNALRTYAEEGANNSFNSTLSNEELMALTAEDVTNTLHKVFDYKQDIYAYSPSSVDDVKALLVANHKFTENGKSALNENLFTAWNCDKPELFIAPYQAANIYLAQISVNGEKLDLAKYPTSSLFDEYFGSGMNSIVFQELRESRGLCYSASSYYTPLAFRKDSKMLFIAYIISQNDKLYECLSTFNSIIENMPMAENAFEIAKTALLKRIASTRTVKSAILSKYDQSINLGIDHDINEDVYKAVEKLTIDDIKAFHAENIKNRTYRTIILGDEKQLDPAILKSQGEIHRLTLEDIFGF